jgi:hypothetical protein
LVPKKLEAPVWTAIHDKNRFESPLYSAQPFDRSDEVCNRLLITIDGNYE